jgi:hypothetical protein
MSDNRKPSPMTYEVTRMPNLARRRQALALDADRMTVAELQAAAEALQVDTAGAKTKKELTQAVKSATTT